MQSTVNRALGAGVVGTLYLDGPSRAQPGIIDSVGAAPTNTVGRAFTQVATADGHCTVGGAIGDGTPFYGILANPSVYASYGTAAGSLAATLNLPQYAEGEFVTMGELWVAVAAACEVGDLVDYTSATGVIVTRAPSVGAPVGGNVNIPGASVSRFNLTGAGLAVIKLNN